jgi:hypothetical protein
MIYTSMIGFNEWMGTGLGLDAYESFLDIVSERLVEGSEEGPLSMQVEFVLEEASKPWKKERWLETNPKIKKTKGVKGFRKDGREVLFEPYLINLLPAKQSGINLCMCATKWCASTCLHTSGAVQFLANKTLGRLRKSWFLALDREEAFRQIAGQIEKKKADIDAFNAKSKTEYRQLIIRLNGTSDLIWRVLKGVEGKNLFEMFPDVVFYDYSKHSGEMESFAKGEFPDGEKFPPNYHMTLSYDGAEKPPHRQTLESGENLAVPFGPGKTASLDHMKFPSDMERLLRNVHYPDYVSTPKQRKEYKQQIIARLHAEGNFASKEELAPFAGQTLLPGLFMCHEVIDGDDYDARFLDDILHQHMNMPNDPDRPEPEIEVDYSKKSKKRHGLVVGLTAKGDLSFSAYKGPKGWDVNHTGFMIGPEDKRLGYECQLQINTPSKADFLKKKNDLYRKVARAIITVRNFDARHVHANDKDEAGNISRTHIKKNNAAKPTQTYLTSKGRTTKEMNELIDVIHAVLRGQTTGIPMDRRKQQATAAAAARLREYLSRPETISLLNDEEFKKRSREFGMDINFDNLAKLVAGHVEGPKPSLMPPETLKMLGGGGFKEWLDGGF